MSQQRSMTRLVPRLLIVCSLVAFFVSIPTKHALAASSRLVISEFLANPTGNDSPFEYVELVATQSIDFAATPYSVVFASNSLVSGATPNGWIAGGTVTYGFNITTGSVKAGDVVYVGGSSMTPTGTKLRTIDTATTPGDRFGSPVLTGVLGNGGAQADGIAVFAADINTLTADTVPVDAIFFGTAMGSAVLANGTAGYQLPVNDLYAGGKLKANSFRAPDPGSTQVVVASGTFESDISGFATPRAWSIGFPTDNASDITVAPPTNKPIAFNCPSALFTRPETSTSTTITATDPDGIAGAPQLVSGAVAGITLTNATAATAVGGTASATLSLASTTAPGIYSVKLSVSNNDSPPLVAECTISVGFVEPNTDVYLPIVTKPQS